MVLLLGEKIDGIWLALSFAPFFIFSALYGVGNIDFRRDWDLLAFTVWGLIYIIFSFLHFLPAAWTLKYDNAAIVQQASFVPVFMLGTSAASRWWRETMARKDINRYLWALIIISLVVGIVVDFVSTGRLIYRPGQTMKNPTLVGLFVLGFMAMRRSRAALIALTACASLAFALHLFAQNLIAYAILFGCLALSFLRMRVGWSVPVKTVSSLFLILLFAASLAAMPYAPAIWRLDANTGWRLAFWSDALDAIVQTHGVGVGFGTEAVKAIYPAMIYNRQFGAAEQSGYLFIGTHSAFWDTGLRLGGVGMLLLIAIIWRSRPERGNVAALLAFMLLIVSTSLNVALQSPTYVVGVVFILGFLRAARSNQPRTLVTAG